VNYLISLSIGVFVMQMLLPGHVVMADIWGDLQGHEYQLNDDVEEYVWQEGDSKVPDYPKESDLVAVNGPSAYSNYQYLIDVKTLNVGADDVVRYSIIIRSASGSDNAFYEGLHCSESRVKTYAFGRIDDDGKQAYIMRKRINWKAVRSSGVNGYTENLATSYFCDHNGAILKRHEIIQNIKYGKGNVDGLYY
jgi:hypothetical protein